MIHQHHPTSMPRSTTSPSPSASTTLTIHTSLSLLYKVLRTIIRPLRPHLVKPSAPFPPGSPRLTSRPKSKNGVTITERHDHNHNLWLYDFHAQPTSLPPHRILYFAGGGFQSPPASEHWSFVSKLAHDLRECYTVTLVSYPLAPNSPASASLGVLRPFLREMCVEASRVGGKVSLMGDSAGGNVVLSLGIWWAGELTPAVELSPLQGVMRNVLAISPACDMRSVNPGIERADRLDPVLTRAMTEQCADAWTGPRDHPTIKYVLKSDQSVSPVLYDKAAFEQVKAVGVKVHGVYGTHDVLAPDAEVLREKLVQADVPGEWLRWEGQMHCFVLAGVYGMSEGKQGIEWCENVLRRNV